MIVCPRTPCVFEAALGSITVPVFIHDMDHLLYVNPAALRLMGGITAEVAIGSNVNVFMHEDSVDASKERRRLALDHGASLRDVPIKGRTAEGTIVRAVSDGERIADTAGHIAIVQMLRQVEDAPTLAYRAPTRVAGSVDIRESACLHEAAFEALPCPIAVHDEHRFLAVNAEARRMISGDVTGLAPGTVTHDHSGDAGSERRAISFANQHTFRGAHVKLRGFDGTRIRVTLDSVPTEHDEALVLVLTVKDAQY